ncbi:hypothetical protein IW140_004362 [Coemansia sp. RSA 1813]|nr:hypothetical protein EV178_004433 [Coemansia sp. RSA 1646]KAJ1768453.1 hypothetical protein LPJ74_004842 [Coemansia sp. RSA 1843]KAJ2087916.1 hypothetical protein IW138_004614 [Coemansia sp. RSA 986]KAJ2212888.1 hypothetical protein EV179_004289 [Coemansia sp. RSA 487]KAJ2567659.1 hypothetical protein IW140_004362 [Coemansia sp. RSA 1813]
MGRVRQATHAGSWYTADGAQLDHELQSWLDDVPDSVREIEPEGTHCQAPVPGARAIIGPHAGLSYSGATAAYAYRCIDVSKVRRVFLLGPSHHVYLEKCALSGCTEYQTPMGNIQVDRETIDELRSKPSGDAWQTMGIGADEDEHSLEMHLPFIYKTFEASIDRIRIVPIMVGNLRFAREQQYGEMLAPYLADEENLFVISSDFCHWGSRFRFTLYKESEHSRAVHLGARVRNDVSGEMPIWKSIKNLDWDGMREIARLDHRAFAQYLEETGNTICGRHPIGVLLAAVNALYSRDQLDGALAGTAAGGPRLRFVKYDQSSKVQSPKDSSVSYASAYLYLPDN